MKRNCVHKKDIFLFIECTILFVLLLLPPLFSESPFTLPPKPVSIYAHGLFCFNTICAAAYEEFLYRLYTPNRMYRIYSNYIEPRLPKNLLATEGAVHLQLSFLLHKHFKYKNTGSFFAFSFIEFPALLLFTLAHRYLGLSSMLFAAGAGTAFRIAYLKLKRTLHPAASIAVVAAIHGFWNIGVYYYLWAHSVAS